MRLEKIEELHNNAERYIAKHDELFNTNREAAKKYLDKAAECQRKSAKLLGITPKN